MNGENKVCGHVNHFGVGNNHILSGLHTVQLNQFSINKVIVVFFQRLILIEEGELQPSLWGLEVRKRRTSIFKWNKINLKSNSLIFKWSLPQVEPAGGKNGEKQVIMKVVSFVKCQKLTNL